MRNLQHFSPAEAFLILYPKQSSRNDLLKATLYDLLSKGILKLHSETLRSKSGLNRTLQFIIADRSLKGYSFLPHEAPFLSPYLKNSRIKMDLKSLTKVGLERSNSEKWYKWDALIEQPRLSSFFVTSKLYKFFRLKVLNEEGKKLQAVFFKEIAAFEKELKQLRRTDKAKASHLAKDIGGCVILLGNFNSKLLNTIGANLDHEYDEMTTVADEGWDRDYDYAWDWD